MDPTPQFDFSSRPGPSDHQCRMVHVRNRDNGSLSASGRRTYEKISGLIIAD
jgi:hypothetical protein